jgi:hypothetical protein
MSEEIFGEEDKRLMTESGKMEDNMNELEEIGADTNYSSKKNHCDSNQNLPKENKTDIQIKVVEGQKIIIYTNESKNISEKEMMGNSKNNNNSKEFPNEFNKQYNSKENFDYEKDSLEQNKKELKDNNQDNNHKNKETTSSNQLKHTQDNCMKIMQKKVEPFNIDIFNKNNNRNEINFEKLFPFKNLKEIVNSKNGIFLTELWENEKIFVSKDELIKMEECEICKKIANYLKEGKNQRKNKKGERMRKTERDQMMIKIITHLTRSFFMATNSFKEFKMCPIAPMKRELINIHLIPDFIFEYLGKPISAILSNESSDRNSITNIRKIEKIINENDKNQEVVKHLNSPAQKCLGYFRYEEENPRFEYKLVDYLIEEFETQKMRESRNFAKEYIASLLLLAFNFELFFQIKKNSRNKDKEEKQINVDKKVINKKRSRSEKDKKDEPFNSSNKNEIISLDINDSSHNSSLSNKSSLLSEVVFNDQKSQEIEIIIESNNQSLKNYNDSIQNNGKIKANGKKNLFTIIK